MTTAKEPPRGPKPASFFKFVISQLKPQRHSEAPANKPCDKLADPTRIGVLSDEPERRTSLKAPASRCQFTFSDGRQCRMQQAHFCAEHSPKPKRGAKRVSDASALEALCSDLTTATSINRALAQTFLLMAQGRISRKDAVAFGYLSQLLLQSVSGVRAEYVAANGYRQWENKLKSGLASNQNDADDPPPSPQNPGNEPNGVILSESASADERRISPNPTQERPLAERIMGKPDYADILSRSLDLLDRKYDFTPEGRSEAQKLALELELMNPAPAKPAKGFFGQTVDLMRRFRDADQRKSGAASIPPAADYYSRPTPPSWADERNEQSVSPPPSRGTSSPNVPNQQACSSEPVAAAAPKAQRSCASSASDPADFVAPPSRRHRKPRSSSSAPSCAPHSELPSPFPISATAPKHDSLGGPDADHHEGHRTDWYAPPSWSKIRPPDPCPTRKEKLQRKLRSMSNSAFRRLQHRNSRGF
jgi:hypothetical protein